MPQKTLRTLAVGLLFAALGRVGPQSVSARPQTQPRRIAVAAQTFMLVDSARRKLADLHLATDGNISLTLYDLDGGVTADIGLGFHASALKAESVMLYSRDSVQGDASIVASGFGESNSIELMVSPPGGMKPKSVSIKGGKANNKLDDLVPMQDVSLANNGWAFAVIGLSEWNDPTLVLVDQAGGALAYWRAFNRAELDTVPGQTEFVLFKPNGADGVILEWAPSRPPLLQLSDSSDFYVLNPHTYLKTPFANGGMGKIPWLRSQKFPVTFPIFIVDAHRKILWQSP